MNKFLRCYKGPPLVGLSREVKKHIFFFHVFTWQKCIYGIGGWINQNVLYMYIYILRPNESARCDVCIYTYVHRLYIHTHTHTHTHTGWSKDSDTGHRRGHRRRANLALLGFTFTTSFATILSIIFTTVTSLRQRSETSEQKQKHFWTSKTDSLQIKT
jgi:hypothetical protein